MKSAPNQGQVKGEGRWLFVVFRILYFVVSSFPRTFQKNILPIPFQNIFISEKSENRKLLKIDIKHPLIYTTQPELISRFIAPSSCFDGLLSYVCKKSGTSSSMSNARSLPGFLSSERLLPLHQNSKHVTTQTYPQLLNLLVRDNVVLW